MSTDAEIDAATFNAARFVETDRALHKELFEKAEKSSPPAIVVEAPNQFGYDPWILSEGSAEEREGYRLILDEARWRGFTVRPLDTSGSAQRAETLHK